MQLLAERFDVPVGLSDHTSDPVTAPAAAAALGASVIEKHITLDRTMEGPDHQFALEPDELTAMIKSVRACETALGERRTDVLQQERELRNIAVRRIYARKNLTEGEIIGESDILLLRPGKNDNALPAKFFDDIVGGVINKDVHANEPLSCDHLRT